MELQANGVGAAETVEYSRGCFPSMGRTIAGIGNVFLIEQVIDVAAQGSADLAEVERVAGIEVEGAVAGDFPRFAYYVFFAKAGAACADIIEGLVEE